MEQKTYTFICDGIVKKIIIPVIFKSGKSTAKVNALIDTGATASFVSKWIPIGLNASRLPFISHTAFAEGMGIGEVYEMDVMFSSDISFQKEMFTTIEGQDREYEAVIGMNILSRTDFSVSNYNDHTIFTFRLPSQGEIRYGNTVTTDQDMMELFNSFEIPL